MIDNSKEYILCSAILFNDGKKHEHQPKNIDNGMVVTGQRHHNCFATVYNIKTMDIDEFDRLESKSIQGFLTSNNRFVNRKEGGEIAYEAGQTMELKETLFSEDLY